jgi:hypothetical protein
VLDIDLDVRISGSIGLGAGADNQRLRIEEAPGGVLRALRAAEADISEDVEAEREAGRGSESLRLLPYSGGGSAGNEVRQAADEPPATREVQTPSSSQSQQRDWPGSSQNEVAEAERLLKSLVSALALRLLSRAVRKTRHAIAEAKRAMKTKDAKRIRQANERLRKAAMRLAGAMHRVGAAATAT